MAPYPGVLTPREQQVLDLIRQGLTNEQIAQRLGISFSGARYRVAEILSKLGVNSRQEAASLVEERKRVWVGVPILGLFSLRTKGSNGLRLLAATASLAAITGILLLWLSGFNWLQGKSLDDGETSNGEAGLGADVAPESMRALEQARLNTPYKRTILFSKGMPTNTGTETDLIASLPRVATLPELKAALSPDVSVIVVDASAMEELVGTSFVHEHWEPGRAIVGLNVCFADMPSSRATSSNGGRVKEISPSGEVRYYDTPNPPQASGRCSWAMQVAQAGIPYVSYVPRRPTALEVQEERSAGGNLIFEGGGTGEA